MSYQRLTKQERQSIEQLLKINTPLNQMAKRLERSPSTIAERVCEGISVNRVSCDMIDYQTAQMISSSGRPTVA